MDEIIKNCLCLLAVAFPSIVLSQYFFGVEPDGWQLFVACIVAWVGLEILHHQ